MAERLKAAEAAIADAHKRQAAARDRAKMAEEDARTMRHQAEASRAELARLSTDLKISQISLTAGQDRIAKAKEQHFKLATKIQDQQDMLAELGDRVAKDTAHAQQLRNRIEALTESRNRLSADAENLKSALSWLEPRVEELAALQARGGEIRSTYARARQEERAQKLELDNNRTEAVTLLQQIASRREILADLTARETEVRDVLSRAQAQVKDVKKAQEKHQETLKTAEADLAELQRQLDATRAERSMVSANVAELAVSRDTLQKKLVELRKQIDELEAKMKQVRATAETRVE